MYVPSLPVTNTYWNRKELGAFSIYEVIMFNNVQMITLYVIELDLVA